jgi:threonine/homoserine/homoserine lactone efflux protein
MGGRDHVSSRALDVDCWLGAEVIDFGLFGPFVLAALLLVVIPGPDMVMIVALGSRDGRAAGVAAAAGVSAGLAVHALIAVLGLSTLLHKLPAVYLGLKWAGVLYLIYLAVTTIRTKPPTVDHSKAVPGQHRSPWAAFRSAMITNVLNPKVILFNVAFLPQFINPHLGHVPLQLAVLGVVLVVIDFCIDGPIGYFAGTLGQRITSAGTRSARRINRAVATVYLALAGWVAATA